VFCRELSVEDQWETLSDLRAIVVNPALHEFEEKMESVKL